MDRIIEVGLIGYGLAGRVFHAPIIASVTGLHLNTVVERHDQKAENRYPGIHSVKSVEEVLTDPDINLVVIAAPNAW